MKKRFEATLVQLRNNDLSVKELNLKRANIGDVGAKDLSKTLKSNTSLTKLNLSYNNIRDIGAKDLSRALQSNTSLTNLNLRGNILGDAGAKDLSETLKVNTSLIHLNLEYNKIGTKGIGYLAQALESNFTLLELEGIDNDEIKKHLARNRLIASCLPQGLTHQDRIALLTKLNTLPPFHQLSEDRYRTEVDRLLTSLGHQASQGKAAPTTKSRVYHSFSFSQMPTYTSSFFNSLLTNVSQTQAKSTTKANQTVNQPGF